MGSLLWRPRKNGTERLVIQWFDATGERRQETIRGTALDGSPLARRTWERDARTRLAEHELEVNRQRAGLAPVSSDVLKTSLRSLIAWWWEQRGKALKSPSVRGFIEKHTGPILDQPLRVVTPARLARLLHTELEGVIAPKSRKHLRAYLYNVFEEARRTGGPWHGRANPVDEVPPVKVPKIPRSILQPDEMEPVIAEVPELWRGPVALALFAGLREGEVFGLRKQEVHLDEGILWVARSWEAPRTKDGKPVPIPVAPPLRPFLEEALKSPGELLFPQPDGTMYPRTLRLGKMLRRAIVGPASSSATSTAAGPGSAAGELAARPPASPMSAPSAGRRRHGRSRSPGTSGSTTPATAS